MRVSVLIEQLTALHAENGDMEVFMDVPSSMELLTIGEVGVDVEDTGIILWTPEEVTADA